MVAGRRALHTTFATHAVRVPVIRAAFAYPERVNGPDREDEIDGADDWSPEADEPSWRDEPPGEDTVAIDPAFDDDLDAEPPLPLDPDPGWDEEPSVEAVDTRVTEPDTRVAEPETPDVSGSPEREPKKIGRRERVIGVLAIVAAFAIVGVLLQLIRAIPAIELPEPPPPAPTYSVEPIPDAARTEVYRSGVAATGTFIAATVNAEPAIAAEKVNDYTVRVEEGINVDPDATARFIQATLDDERGWAAFGRNAFRLVAASETPAFTITIAAPATVDALCGPDAKTDGLWSCFADGAIVVNSDRWHFMTPTFSDLDQYRAWLINHQVGRFLGQGTAYCGGEGQPSPVMAEQERILDRCVANAWPKL